jgi:hypothetical protein
MLLSKIITYVVATSAKFGIDESHGLSHSLQTLYYANQIFDREVIHRGYIKPQERLIYISAAIHDMCDKKYMDEATGVANICQYLNTINAGPVNKSPLLYKYEVEAVGKIISTMSYSKVKRYGFPNLSEFQTAYHIVRESDLLAAYDFDRSMIYNIHHNNATLDEAFHNARELFMTRVLKQIDDKLFFTDYAREEAHNLHADAIVRMEYWNHILNKQTRGYTETRTVWGKPRI